MAFSVHDTYQAAAKGFDLQCPKIETQYADQSDGRTHYLRYSALRALRILAAALRHYAPLQLQLETCSALDQGTPLGCIRDDIGSVRHSYRIRTFPPGLPIDLFGLLLGLNAS